MSALVGLSLSTEGPTDQAFLTPIIRRLGEQFVQAYISAENLELDVVLAGVRDLYTLGTGFSGDIYARLKGAAVIGVQTHELIFIHGDGAGDWKAAETNVLEPKIKAIASVLSCEVRFSRIIPVREMEAWAVADGDAIRRAYKVTLDNARLGIVSPARRVETIADPKRSLRDIGELCLGKRRSKKLGVTVFLSLIAEHLSFQRLLDVPSFRRFYEESDSAFHDLMAHVAEE